MRAALCSAFEGPAAVAVGDIAEPSPHAGEVLVRVRAAALNFFDTLLVRNSYQYKPTLPFSPGGEMCGVIEGLGEGVAGVAKGQRVLGYLGWGCCRELVTAPAEALVRVPASVTDEVAAGLSVAYGTAMHGLIDRGRLEAGNTLAVLGAAGGTGLAAVQIGAQLGARVIAVASTSDKLALCKSHGAHEGLISAGTDLKTALKDLTGGKGVDVIYDCVGSDQSEQALRAIAWQGRFLVVGFAGGAIPRLPLNLPLLKGCDVVGVFWGEFLKREPKAQRRHLARVLAWVEAGAIRPHVHAAYPLAGTAEALRVLERREATGKVVVTIS